MELPDGGCGSKADLDGQMAALTISGRGWMAQFMDSEATAQAQRPKVKTFAMPRPVACREEFAVIINDLELAFVQSIREDGRSARLGARSWTRREKSLH